MAAMLTATSMTGTRECWPSRDQPGERGIADPHVPVGPVHGDAVRGVVEVERVERQPVEELPVVAVRLGHRHAVRQLGRRGEMPADQDEPADAAVRPGLPAGQGEGDRGERGDQGGHGGAVRPDASEPDAAGPAGAGGTRRASDRASGMRLRDPRAGRRVLLTRHAAFLTKGGPDREHRRA